MLYQQSLDKSRCHLILEVVSLATLLRIGSVPLLLKPFCSSIEDLEAGSSGRLNGVESTISDDGEAEKRGPG
jgi:hypothetical protein